MRFLSLMLALGLTFSCSVGRKKSDKESQDTNAVGTLAQPRATSSQASWVSTMPPLAFSIIAPSALTSDATPEIRWSEATGALTYSVAVDDDSKICDSPIEKSEDLSLASYEVVTPLSRFV